MYSIELRQNRAKLNEDNKSLLAKAREEKRDLSKEESEEWDKRDVDIATLGTQIERYEAQDTRDRELNKVEGRQVPSGNEGPGVSDNPKADKEVTNRAFDSFLRYGKQGMNAEERSVLAPFEVRGAETRAQSVGTTTAGGFTVPEDWRADVMSAMLAFGGMRQVSFILATGEGGQLHIPTSDDTGNVGVILAENTAAAEQDITFAEVVLDAYKYSSKMIKVSHELLNDSAIDIGAFIRSRMVERLGRITNTHYTTGTGSSQPNGVVTAGTLGKTAATNAAITYIELLDLKHSVDPSYRNNARWMFNDSTLKAIKQLVDGQSRPLWVPGIAVREPDSIDGDPYTINQDVASIATVAKTVLYGDFSKYWIRDTGDFRVIRLDERFADADQVAFVAFMRSDADLIDAGTAPIKFLAQAS